MLIVSRDPKEAVNVPIGTLKILDPRLVLARRFVKERIIFLAPRNHGHPTVHMASPNHQRPRDIRCGVLSIAAPDTREA
jgi:hypothetical protein